MSEDEFDNDAHAGRYSPVEGADQPPPYPSGNGAAAQASRAPVTDPAATTAAPANATGGANVRGGVTQFRSAAQGSYDVAKQRAAERLAQEREAALRAKDQAVALGHETRDAVHGTAQLVKDVAEDAQDLPPAALAGVAKENMNRVHGQYAANMAMLNKNKEALQATQAEAQKRMTELQGAGRQALETAVAVTVDIARGEFEARCAKVLEQEGKLALMAQEIERREKQLSLLRSRGEPNWPCNCCCFSPIVHHDIAGDIPRMRQGFMKKAYANWFFTLFLLIANCAVAVTMMALKDESGAGESKTSTGQQIQHLVVSIVMLSGCIFSFVIWYWPSYKALGTGSSGQYLQAKVGVAVGIVYDLFVCLGPVGYGGCGIFYGVQFVQPQKGKNAFIVCVILVVLFAIQIIIFIYMWFKLRSFGKEDKASLAKAKLEYMGSELRSSIGI